MNLQTKVPSWLVWIIVLPVIYLLFFGCCGVAIPGVDILFFLAFGWIWFLVRVIPQIYIRWDLIVSTTIYLIVFLAGSHWFLRWLHREMAKAAIPNDPGASQKWKFSATLSLFGIIVLMFLVGMSAIGIAHQTAWLLTAPEPLYNHDHRDGRKAKCSSNLKNIAAALITYANTHGGRYPDDMRELLISSGMTPAILVCPASNDMQIQENTPEAISAGLAAGGHCSYLYFARGFTTAAPDDTVLVTEPLENHGGKGINVLYNDYHVSWIAEPEAGQLLASLKARSAAQSQTQSTTQP